jgi:dipeptidyl aminopeptidase/acylaminoacyl peptidase
VVSEEISPTVPISPIASDGHLGEGFLRKPPGNGPFPAVVLIHGGLAKWPTEEVREFAGHILASRFLYEGYVVATITSRSRDTDPNSPVSLRDTVAAVEHLKSLPYVDPESVVVRGTSGGGDLALQIASTTSVAAIVPEEPATMLMAGVFTVGHVAALVGGGRAPEAFRPLCLSRLGGPQR